MIEVSVNLGYLLLDEEYPKVLNVKNKIDQTKKEIEEIRSRLIKALGLGGIFSLTQFRTMGSKEFVKTVNASSLPLLIYADSFRINTEYRLVYRTDKNPEQEEIASIGKTRLEWMLKDRHTAEIFVRYGRSPGGGVFALRLAEEKMRPLVGLLVNRHAFVQKPFHPADSMPFMKEKEIEDIDSPDEIKIILRERMQAIEALHKNEQALMHPFGLGGVVIRPEFNSKALLRRLKNSRQPLLLVINVKEGHFCLLYKASGPSESYDLPLGQINSSIHSAVKRINDLGGGIFIRKTGRGSTRGYRIATLRPPDKQTDRAFTLFKLFVSK